MENQLIVVEEKSVSIIEKLLSAAQQGLTVDVIEKFMDLAERNERREAEKAFHRAFAAFKADPPEIVKSKLVDFTNNAGKRTKYKHATIGDVVKAIIGGMSKHGLSHRWNVSQDGKNITVACHVTHELGHSEITTLSAGADESGGKNAIQAIASTVTYLERYTLQAATGIAVLENDDDGMGGENFKQPGKKEQQIQKQETSKDRDHVDKWLNWIDGHCRDGITSEMLELGYNQYLEPIKEKLAADHWNEITIAYKDTIKFLKEREGAK